MIEQKLTDEQVQDGLAFARLKQDEKAWPAIERLVRRLHDDAIARWADDKSGDYGKKWLKGSREMAAAIIPAIEGLAQDAIKSVESEKEAQVIARTTAEDGMGSGDLAIA